MSASQTSVKNDARILTSCIFCWTVCSNYRLSDVIMTWWLSSSSSSSSCWWWCSCRSPITVRFNNLHYIITTDNAAVASLLAAVGLHCTRWYAQVYLLTPMDRATLSHAKSQVAHCTQVKSPGSKRCERYLKHIATQTVTCWLLAHTYTARPKLHLVDLFHFFGRHIVLASLQEIYKKSNRWSFSLSVSP